jgi:hypothetical protein
MSLVANVEKFILTLSSAYHQDLSPPTFATPPSSPVVECTADSVAHYDQWLKTSGGANAVDTCGPPSVSTVVDVAAATREWAALAQGCTRRPCLRVAARMSAVDDCGLEAIADAAFTVVDTVAPRFAVDPASVRVSCSSNVNVSLMAWLQSGAGAVAVDACGPATVTATLLQPFTRSCSQNLSAVFVAQDGVGNTISKMASFIIEVRLNMLSFSYLTGSHCSLHRFACRNPSSAVQ